MPYMASLDGLRALAITLVLLFHAKVPGLPGGNIGVDIFFVLSGFLITRLLLVEWQIYGVVQIRRFYLRRIWRLMPPLVLCVLLYLLVAPLIWPDYYFHLRDVILTLLYMGNIAVVFGYEPSLLVHGWSLALEEQFYLIWPLLLVWLCRTRFSLWFLLFCAYLLANGWRLVALAFLDVHPVSAYFRPDLHCSGLLLGAALAAWVHKYGVFVGLLSRRVPWLCLGGLGLTVLLPQSGGEHLLLMLPLAEVSVAGLIFCFLALPDAPLQNCLEAPLVVLLGKLSYGVYLFHYPVMAALREFHFDWRLVFVLGTGLSLLLAAISYYGLESRVRQYRLKRFS